MSNNDRTSPPNHLFALPSIAHLTELCERTRDSGQVVPDQYQRKPFPSSFEQIGCKPAKWRIHHLHFIEKLLDISTLQEAAFSVPNVEDKNRESRRGDGVQELGTPGSTDTHIGHPERQAFEDTECPECNV